MKIERFKLIARYISERTGIGVTDHTARKWASRASDPLPLERFAGRVVADSDALDAWIARQRGAERKQASSPRARRHSGAQKGRSR